MNTKHTSGNWEAIGNLVRTSLTEGGLLVAECRDSDGQPHSDEAKRYARLIAAAPDLFQELKKRADNAEQSAFEDWLERKSPSGDAESVHRQWKESGDFQAYADEWRHALDAIEKATGVSHVHDQ